MCLVKKHSKGYVCGQHIFYNLHAPVTHPLAGIWQRWTNEVVLESGSFLFLTLPKEIRKTIKTILLVAPFKLCWKMDTPSRGDSDSIWVQRRRGEGRRSSGKGGARSMGQDQRGKSNVGFGASFSQWFLQIPGGREDEEGKEEKRVNGKKKEKKTKQKIKIGNRRC